MGENDRFGPGKWQLEGWMESDKGSGRGDPGAQIETIKLTPEQAESPPVEVFFSRFYQGERDWTKVSFRDGEVGGSLRHGQVDVPISGTYSDNHFRVTFGFNASGLGISQVVEGKLVEPAP
jgi:hypothetical protein